MLRNEAARPELSTASANSQRVAPASAALRRKRPTNATRNRLRADVQSLRHRPGHGSLHMAITRCVGGGGEIGEKTGCKRPGLSGLIKTEKVPRSTSAL